jgi:carboxyl-terminal processing protease
MNQNRQSRYIPLIISVSVVVGIAIGSFYANHFSGNRLSIINTSSNKINDLLHYIDDQYVDTVNMADLVEQAMPQILSELDPHSAYIGAKDVENETSKLKGSFSGIGVQFTVQDDTINISSVIKGGPSEKVGIMAGDRIVSVNGKPFVGKAVTDNDPRNTLKGPKGTKIKLGIKRNGESKILYFTIVRGDIPTKSINAVYMLNPTTGYIKVDNFGETTYTEMIIALAQLNAQHAKNLVIDLRGNLGGLLNTAVMMANEFLPKDRLILYTEGRKSPRQEYRSDGRGTYKDMPLVVLVDEASASASEIFAGAIQDNDRGTIIGRRTFGKGLVQLPIEFRDGSMLRLTVARYYTPSGRCIQKPYKKGDREAYDEDLLTRYEHGEFFSQDSIKQKGPKYRTYIGRTVYGGGGIMPDIFVPEDTLNVTSYYKEALFQGLVVRFAFHYTDLNRTSMLPFSTTETLLGYLEKQNLIDKFARFAETKGLKRRNLMIRKSRHLLERAIYGNIIYNMQDIGSYTKYINESDPTVWRAITLLEKGQATPRLTPARRGR